MSEPNDRLERAYRSLAREEPPASLDASILAAARRAVARPSLARRWGVPVSAAAVLALAIGVTLEMQHERPGIEVSAPASESAPAPAAKQEMAAPARAPEAKPEAALVAPEKRVESRQAKSVAATPGAETHHEPAGGESAPGARDVVPEMPAVPAARSQPGEAPAASAERERAPASAQRAPASAQREVPQTFPAAPPASRANAAMQAPRAQAAPSLEGAPAAPPSPAAAQEGRLAAPAASMAKRSAGAGADLSAAPASPAAELERIAKLREEGRDVEADRALEEFRKRFPAYRIDDATWRRVKPR